MKQIAFIIVLWALAALRMSAQQGTVKEMAQEEWRISIFDVLGRPNKGKGGVIVHQPEAVRNMVGVHTLRDNIERTPGNEFFLKLNGYRAQVFSGNNQRESKEEAFEKEREIKEMFPFLYTYVTYTAPFWKLRVGDCRSPEEAYLLLRRLKDAFPTYGKEMYIIREEIRVPLH